MIFEIVLPVALTGVIISAAAALKFRDMMASVVLLCAMSLFMAASFYILQAPDVAIAEASIGAGISTAVYVIAVSKTGRREDEKGD
ncbi:MAG: DUF4040 domain-containing protein [Candidatus Aenigmarchaeota archaeon]|nr:DUF4040 domain-containing protein [Candidatus Aenigmarchaeota archaeon]